MDVFFNFLLVFLFSFPFYKILAAVAFIFLRNINNLLGIYSMCNL